jgi:hypothetical protein
VALTGIEKAILKASGGYKPRDTALAKLLGVSKQAVYVWRLRGWVPSLRAIEIERELGIPRDELLNPSLAPILLQFDKGNRDANNEEVDR